MNNQQKYRHTSAHRRIAALLLATLACCLLLLSACGSTASPTTSAGGIPTPLPTPSISPTLRNQGDMQLQAFQQWISLLQQNQGDVTTYQQQYSSDQQALSSAKTGSDYQAALQTLTKHVEGIKLPAMKAQALALQQQLKQQVSDFGKQHTYHDTYNGVTYPQGYEYGDNGIGSWIQDEITSAQTLADFQQVVEDEQMWLSNFAAMKADFGDKTPYNQPHKSDLQLMQQYGYMDKRMVVVSLAEQAMRIYDHGKLVKAFLVTTGRPDKPTPPGSWWVEGKKSPTVFKADVPKSSPYWYPDTPINYAMQYHSNGYFLHDSWWRADYGPGTNFPHQDSSGDSFSAQGSHGCVNLSKADAGWVYGFVIVYTKVMIY